MTVPALLIESLDRLNSHARTAHGFMSTERNAIYAYKDFVTAFLTQRGEVKARLVKWTGTCGSCSGTGQWIEYWANERQSSRCRRCYGLGKVTLQFTETTLPTGSVWHHPWSAHGHGRDIAWAALGHTGKSPCGGWDTFDSDLLTWEEPGDWHPRKEGLHLDVNLLVPFLNYVEDWILSTPTVEHGASWWWLRDTAVRMIGGYRLDAGDAPPRCAICGGEPECCRIGHIDQHLHWSIHSCASHRKEAFAMKEPPAELITPIIKTWLDRRAVNAVQGGI